jgi:DNA-binding CsgD family transcriptional regulator/tetratricopeptide (TPR) repeat protein
VSGAAIVTGELIGRDRELAQLLHAIDNPPSVTVIEGEPGVGKTRLLQEIQVPVLAGSADPLRKPMTLGPIVEALSHASLPANAALRPVTGLLRPLLPELADRLPPAQDPSCDSHARMRALRELIAAIAPVTIVLEDLHLADEESVEFATYLASRIPDGVALICTQSAPRVRAPGALRIALGPLSREQTATLARQPESVSERLYENTAGIPGVLVELLAQIDATDSDPIHLRQAIDTAEVPPRVRDRTLAVLAALTGADARRLVEAAAVLREPTNESQLAQIAGVAGDRVTDALSEAELAGLLTERGPAHYGVRYRLQSRAIEHALASARRRRLHARAAQILDSTLSSRLARHHKAAGNRAQWLRYGEAAADAATTLVEHVDAYEFLKQVVALEHVALTTRGRLAVKLATHASAAFANRDAIEIVSDLTTEQGLTAGIRGELRLRLGLLLHEAGDSKAGYAEIERSIDELQRRPAIRARAMSMLAAPAFAQGRLDEQLHWLDRAVQTAARSNDQAVKIAVAVDRAAIRLSVGLPEGWHDLKRIPAPGPDAEELRQAARGCANISDALVHTGHYRLARTWIQEGRSLPGAIADSRGMLALPVSELQLDWLTGRWGGLEERLRAQLQASRAWPALQADTNVVLALLRFAQGDSRTATELLDRYVEEFQGEAQVHTWVIAGRANLRLADGDPQAALSEASRELKFVADKGVWAWASDLVPVAVMALNVLRRTGEAAELNERFGDEIDGRDAPAAAAANMLGTALILQARGDLTAAAATFSQTEQAWRALPRPYEAAKALERGGLCRLQAGGEGDLKQALSAFGALGARWDVARVQSTLRRHGIEPAHRRGRRGYGDELSPREREVATLAAAGATNREIALELFLSPKTVEHYVSAAMRKLGVSSRTALPGAGNGGPKIGGSTP